MAARRGTAIEGVVKPDEITGREWHLSVGPGTGLFRRLSAMPYKMGDVADIFVGLQTSADDVFVMDFVAETDRTIRLMSKSLAREWPLRKIFSIRC